MPPLRHLSRTHAPGAILAKIESWDFPAGMESTLRDNGLRGSEQRQGGKPCDEDG